MMKSFMGAIFSETEHGETEQRRAAPFRLASRNSVKVEAGIDRNELLVFRPTTSPSRPWGKIAAHSAPLLVLGILLFASPAWSSSTSYLPLVEHDPIHETGLTIANTTGTVAQVTITAYDAAGNQIGQVQKTLGAGGQIADVLPALFSLPDAYRGWLRVDGTMDLAVLGALFKTDTGQSTALPVLRVPDVIQFLAHVAIGGGWTTSVVVANVSPQTSNATLVLYDSDGTLVGTSKIQLPALGQTRLDVGATFKVGAMAGGHLEVVTEQPAVASETFALGTAFTAVGAQRLGVADTDAKWTRWFPYTGNDSSHWTGLAYANVTGVPSLVRVDLIASDGSLVASKADLLPAEGQSALALSDIAKNWQGTGYVRVSADAPIAAPP